MIRKHPDIALLEAVSHQCQLLEYESHLRSTPSGTWHPMPPVFREGRLEALNQIERVGAHLGMLWRSDVNVRADLQAAPENSDAYGRTHRADLFTEYRLLTSAKQANRVIEWAKDIRCHDDMFWVHIPGAKNWELVYVEGYPGGVGRFCARSTLTEEVLYELRDNGDSLHGNIPKLADCPIQWSLFKQDKGAYWNVAASKVMDEWAEREGFSLDKSKPWDFTGE